MALVSIEANNITDLKVNELRKITLTFDPPEENPEVTYESSDNLIATVDTTGNVKGIKIGSTAVTIKSVENPEILKTINVTVIPTLVTGITLNKNSETIDSGKTFQIVPTITPNDATDKTVTYKSLNDSIATVSTTGLVTGKSKGIVVIEVSATNNKKANLSLTVLSVAESVSVEPKTSNLILGSQLQLTKSIIPSDVLDKDVTFTVDNDNISVSPEGLVTTNKVGTSKITMTYNKNNELHDIATVNVLEVGPSDEEAELIQIITEEYNFSYLREGEEFNTDVTMDTIHNFYLRFIELNLLGNKNHYRFLEIMGSLNQS